MSDQPPLHEITAAVHQKFDEEEGPRTEEIRSFIGLLNSVGYEVVEQ